MGQTNWQKLPNDGHFLVEKHSKKGPVTLCPNGDYREEPQENEDK